MSTAGGWRWFGGGGILSIAAGTFAIEPVSHSAIIDYHPKHFGN
jgi:hypothetical protein